ncbi:hypothetical protein [Hydrogenophaga sp. 2FB]|uniref:hypothetical protein n=1 Tax=Hydrogenophaga sp. 2FB TaxID=2502187 RepID=UPI0010F8EE6B|nr:hypothetical protein [Hydrogenophaga sp. 2FB]
MNEQLKTDPARHVCDSVRQFNAVIALIVSPVCLDAVRNGDGSTAINGQLFAASWEGCGPFRDQLLMCLARTVRDEWRRDVASIIENEPAESQATSIARSLDIRLRTVLDFAFRYLGPRQVCLVTDCLVMCFESDMKSSEIVHELAVSAGKSPYAKDELLQATVLGGSGMYRYKPESLILSRRT